MSLTYVCGLGLALTIGLVGCAPLNSQAVWSKPRSLEKGLSLGANLVIPTEPDRVEIRNVKFYHTSYGFQEAEPGRFQLRVTLRYRKWTSRIEQFKHFMFRLQSGTIVQRDDRTLVLRLDTRERVVGRHHWWYAPDWQTADGVQIACSRRRQSRSVVLEHCRLIVS
jgi:hypothetical protein